MSSAMKLGVVILAAGKSSRFGENKLLADYKGRPMVCCAMDAVKGLRAEQTAVITGSDAVAELAYRYGYRVIRNDEPQKGQSHSIRLGVSAMAQMDAVLLLVGDQPLLTQVSLVRLLEAFQASDKSIACLRDETHMGNPAVFSAKHFDALCALAGDRGAKGILCANEDELLVVPCAGAHELADADTPQALAAIKDTAR